MPSLPAQTTQTPERQAIALDYLRMARKDRAEAARRESYYMGLARDYGCTIQQIADALGLTYHGAHYLLERGPKK